MKTPVFHHVCDGRLNLLTHWKASRRICGRTAVQLRRRISSRWHTLKF